MSDRTRYRFGAFELDPLAHELTRDGTQVPLQDHPFRLLLTLLLRPGELVSREELVEALWPPGTFVDSEHGLNTAIRKLRRALGESTRQPALLETLPRRGYRLAAVVETVTPGSLASVAILPLADLSPQRDHGHVVEAFAEELTRLLGAIAGVTIAPRSASFRQREQEPRRAGMSLGVRHVVAGRLRVDGERISIACRLIEVATGREPWAGRFDRQLVELLLLAEAIAREVASSLIERLLPRGAELPVVDRAVASAGAYDLYLRARSAWRLRGHSTLRAISLFERALELDRDYAPALQGIAACYYSAAIGGHLPSSEAADRLAAASRRAVELAPEDGASWLVEGMRREWVEGSRRRAADAYRRAIDRSPRGTTAYGWLAMLLSASGRFDDAIATARRAVAIGCGEPSAAAYLGWSLFFARRFEDALAVFEPSSEFAVAWIARAWIFERTGRLDEALAAVDEAVASNETRWAQRERVRILAALGRAADANEALENIVESGIPFPPFDRGLLALARGERSRAAVEFALAHSERSPWLRFRRVDPRLDPLRDAPELSLPNLNVAGRTRPQARSGAPSPRRRRSA